MVAYKLLYREEDGSLFSGDKKEGYGCTFVVGMNIHEGEVNPCKRGFHACEKLQDVFIHRTPNPNIEIWECEASGTIKIEGNKIACSHLELKRKVELPEIIKEEETTLGWYLVWKLGMEMTREDLNNLTRVELHNTQVKVFDPKNCPNLTRVDLRNTQVKVFDPKNCPNLTSVGLDNTQVKVFDPKNCPNLTSVGLDNTQVEVFDPQNCPNLTTVYLRNTEVGDVKAFKLTHPNCNVYL